MNDNKAGEPVAWYREAYPDQPTTNLATMEAWRETGWVVIDCYTAAPSMQAEQAPCDIPAGWQLVPIEPTDAMLEAGRIPTVAMALGNGNAVETLGLGATPFRIYKAMLSAAPSE